MRSILHLIVLLGVLFAGVNASAEQKVIPIRGELTASSLMPVTKLLDSGWRVVLVSTGGYAWACGTPYTHYDGSYLHTIFVLESPAPSAPPPVDLKASALSKLTPSERAALGLEASTPVKD